jgi:putative nucleotidyltransferase with HDIG domain
MLLREIHKVSITVPGSKKSSIKLLVKSIDKLILRGNRNSEFFLKVCKEIIKIDNYRFAWIGLAKKNKNKDLTKIESIAHYGSNGFTDDLLNCLLREVNSRKKPFLLSSKSKRHEVKRYTGSESPKAGTKEEIILKNNFSSSILLPLIHNNRILGLINIFSDNSDSFNEQENKILLKIADNLSNDIRGLKLEIQLKDAMKQLQRALYETIDAITLMTEIKDPYTSGHQKRVAIISSAIATELGLPKDTIDGIYVAGLLHDVGKISVPNDILAKPGKLNEGEFIIIKNHPIVSYNILEHIEFPWPIANIVNQHHERIDGSGYPHGVLGDEMSIGSRILSVADVVEAMTAHRPYRPALGLKKALSEIGNNKGTLYDREITEACIKVFKEKKVKF